MYYATIMQSKVQKWWTGSQWSTEKVAAKQYEKEQDAWDELESKRIHYFDQKAGRWQTPGVNVNRF